MTMQGWQRLARSSYRRAENARRRFDLSASALALLALAIVALAAASTVLAKVSEDVLARNGLETSDASNLQSVVAHRSAWLVDTARWFTQIGSIGLLVVIATVVGALLWFKGARLAVAAAPLVSLLAAGAVAALVKVLVARDRPPVALRLVTETEPSFPSGHSTDSAALFVAIGIVVAAVLLRRPIARALSVAAGFVAAALVGVSRLVLGVHWPTDVLAGWALGTVVAVATTTMVLVLVRATPGSAGDGRLGRATDRVLRAVTWQRPAAHEAAPA